MAIQTRINDIILLIARILLTGYFFTAALEKLFNFNGTLALLTQSKVPMPLLALIIAICMELVGSLLVIIGYYPRIGALLLILFTIPVTLTMHEFWAAHDPAFFQNQMHHFFKNFAIIGGLLYIAVCGAGKISLDFYRRIPAQAGTHH